MNTQYQLKFDLEYAVEVQTRYRELQLGARLTPLYRTLIGILFAATTALFVYEDNSALAAITATIGLILIFHRAFDRLTLKWQRRREKKSVRNVSIEIADDAIVAGICA